MKQLLLRIIRFGTERFPEKVARRLRLVNIICWFAAMLVAQFAVRRLIDPDTFEQGLVAVAVSTCFALIPLLHRFGSAAAIFALTVLAYADGFRVTWIAGTGGGYWLGFFAAVSLMVPALGAERMALAGVLSAIAGGLVIALHLLVPFNAGELPPDVLRAAFLTNVVFYTILIFAVVFYAAWQIERAEVSAEREQRRSDSLIANILPASIAERLKLSSGLTVADRYDEASVLFGDMAGFTARAASMAPEDLVRFLDRVFSEFDRLVESHGVEKIKTSGDSYMAVSGVPERRFDHAQALANLALEMLDTARNIEGGVPIRIGIACGPVVAGIVGSRKFFYDVWGDAVNIASRMESTGEPGKIQVSQDAHRLLRNEFVLERRGTVEIKGKGRMITWFLTGRKARARPCYLE